jgi:hypothetical protein
MNIQYWNGKEWIWVKNDKVREIEKSLEEYGFRTVAIHNQTANLERSIIKALLESDKVEK